MASALNLGVGQLGNLQYAVNVTCTDLNTLSTAALPSGTYIKWNIYQLSTVDTESKIISSFNTPTVHAETGKQYYNVYSNSNNYPILSGQLPYYNQTGFALSPSSTMLSFTSGRGAYGRVTPMNNGSVVSNIVDYYSNVYPVSGYINLTTLVTYISYGIPTPTYTDLNGEERTVSGAAVSGLGSYNIVYNNNYTWGTSARALTADFLSLTIPDAHNKYLISATAVGYTAGSAAVLPYYLYLIGDTYFNYSDVSAVETQNDISFSNLYYNISVQWMVSDELSATDANSTTHRITAGTPLTLDAIYCSAMRFETNSLSTYYISALEINDRGVMSPTPAVHVFNSDAYDSENLIAGVLDYDKADRIAWFKMTRNILGQSGSYYTNFPINSLTSVKWTYEPLTTNTVMYSGMTGVNLQAPYAGVDTSLSAMRGGIYTQGVVGYTGILNSVSADDVNSIDTLGLDIVAFRYNALSAVTYTVTAQYTNYDSSTASYDVFTFTPQMSTQSLYVSSLYMDDQPQIKQYNLRLCNNYFGQIVSINDGDYIAWNAVSNNGNSDSIWAKYEDGTYYTFNNPDPTVGTLNFYISTEKSTTPQLSSFTVYASAIKDYSMSTATYKTTSYNISAYEYVDDADFDVTFYLNHQDPRTCDNRMWRLTSDSYMVTAFDMSVITNAVSYQNIWNWGDGSTTITSDSSATHVFYAPSITSYTITYEVSNALINNVHYSKESDDYINLQFINRFLSASFVLYPTTVLPTSSLDDMIDNSMVFTYTNGVSAYGEGHTEQFIISSTEPATVTFGVSSLTNTYMVKYGNNTKSVNIPKTFIEVQTVTGNTFVEEGTAVTLNVFNDLFPFTMISAYVDDNNVASVYPNFGDGNSTGHTTSSNSNIFMQNMKMLPYETPTCTITSNDNIFYLPGLDLLTLSEESLLPVNSPVTMSNKTITWYISTQNWVDTRTTVSDDAEGTSVSYLFDRSETGTEQGKIMDGWLGVITVSAAGVVDEIIETSDWQSSQKQFASTNVLTLSVYSLPLIKVYTDNKYALTGENITFVNLTNQNIPGLIDSFIWDLGNDTIVTVSGFDAVTTSYSTIGNKTLTVSAITYEGYVYTQAFTNIVTILADYETYDSDIFRTYGEGALALPNSYENIQLPPNEWVVSDNINAAFRKLNENLDYIVNACKVYSLPPYYYYGWLGSLSSENVPQWHVNITNLNNDYLHGYNTATTYYLSGMKDMVIKNNLMYIAKNTSIQIRDTDFNSTLITERTYKAINDTFADLVAIDVDSNGRIYVLDNLKNKVSVFQYDSSLTIDWDLLNEWGGLGSATSKYKFYNPTDLKIDNDDNLWVVDSNNACIKKYSSTGSWLKTITSSYLTQNNKPIAITIDGSNRLHILTNKYVLVLNASGEYVMTYEYKNVNNSTPKKIKMGSNGDYVYICMEDSVSKNIITGEIAGNFGSLGVSYKSMFIDDIFNVYLLCDNFIIKYNDKTTIINLILDTTDHLWSEENINIDKDEDVAEWVYNKTICKIRDNLEIIRRSVIGKLSITQDPLTLTYVMDIVPFTPAEYDELYAIDTGDIYIGINEIVSSQTVNRCLKQIYDGQSALLEKLEITG